MKNSVLYKFAFRFLIATNPSGIMNDFKNKLIIDENNIFRLIHLSSNHLVLPALYMRLKDFGLNEYFPKDLIEHIKEIYLLNAERNKKILQQIDEINWGLNQSGIEPVYLKGTGNLLDNLYSNSAERMLGDIDFLVKEKDYLKTAEIFLKNGYKNDFKTYDNIKTLTHYPRLYREDLPAPVEIHRLPVIQKYSKTFEPEIIFQEKKQIPGKLNCFVPSDNHKIIQTFIHSQLTNKGHVLKIVSLRDLYDSYLLSKRVNLAEVFKQTDNKKEAKIYYDLISLLTNDEVKFPGMGKESQFFFKKHKWFLNHPRLHFVYINILKFKDLIVNRFLKAFIDKSVLRNLIVRISDLQWWRNRLWSGIKEYFT